MNIRLESATSMSNINSFNSSDSYDLAWSLAIPYTNIPLDSMIHLSDTEIEMVKLSTMWGVRRGNREDGGPEIA